MSDPSVPTPPGHPGVPPIPAGDRRCPRRDPDNVVLCLLAADEEEAGDAALQIHFTLIQAFCCENDINILRVSNPARLAQLLLPATGPEPPADLHCVLVTVSGTRPAGPCAGVTPCQGTGTCSQSPLATSCHRLSRAAGAAAVWR